MNIICYEICVNEISTAKLILIDYASLRRSVYINKAHRKHNAMFARRVIRDIMDC